MRSRGIGLDLGMVQMQGSSGITQTATDANQIANLRTATPQRLPFGHQTERGHRDRQGAVRGIATNQSHAGSISQGAKTIEKSLDEASIGLWQSKGQQHPGGRGRHRRQVREIDRQRLPANIEWRGINGKMHPGIEGVATGHQRLP